MVADLTNLEIELLAALTQDSSTPQKDLAQKLELSTSAISRLRNDLENKQVIKGYTAQIDYSALGYSEIAYFFFAENSKSHTAETEKFLCEIDEVIEITAVFAEDIDYVLKIMARDSRDLMRIMKEVIIRIHLSALR
jgi:Lrp/AsnC family leucine-responsive transcriptional regulator